MIYRNMSPEQWSELSQTIETALKDITCRATYNNSFILFKTAS
ncbi:hypothetical protein Slin_3065 [Spirosoma linguale DSM 74]|uniref:Uncharacterized protein n=1 Tax=Spirosoma linguale (strain ATCC 33905 / DSM 74 / LMG 10896 / Claus 1) TaxID=504472 RepID=D2QLC9_SPILD|nr:hypothetical protein Slin_3065 [Spirosoma linguale DSM 74]